MTRSGGAAALGVLLPLLSLCGLARSARILHKGTSFSVALAGGDTVRAVAVLGFSNNTVAGTVRFSQQGGPSGATQVVGTISGLTPGNHGFHVHASGNTSAGCASTGPHFNPFNSTHGGLGTPVRHAGDLGNVLASRKGVARFSISAPSIPLFGQHSILGVAVVVHAAQDDLGQGGTPLSNSTGNSGARLACGVINLDADAAQPGDPGAIGNLSLQIRRQRKGGYVLDYNFFVHNISGTAAPTAASINKGTPTQAGAAVVSFSQGTWNNRGSSTSPVWNLQNSTTVNPNTPKAAAIRLVLAHPSAYYASVVTASYPSGAVRGQLRT